MYCGVRSNSAGISLLRLLPSCSLRPKTQKRHAAHFTFYPDPVPTKYGTFSGLGVWSNPNHLLRLVNYNRLEMPLLTTLLCIYMRTLGAIWASAAFRVFFDDNQLVKFSSQLAHSCLHKDHGIFVAVQYCAQAREKCCKVKMTSEIMKSFCLKEKYDVQ